MKRLQKINKYQFFKYSFLGTCDFTVSVYTLSKRCTVPGSMLNHGNSVRDLELQCITVTISHVQLKKTDRNA